MVKINEILNYEGVSYKRISLAKVKSLIKTNGLVNVNLIPSKANIFSEWITFYNCIISDLEELEKTINSFSFYNCNYNQLGDRIGG